MSLPHDGWAEHYERVMHLSFGDTYAELTSVALDEIRARVPPPARVVDFGAGTGRLAVPLAREGYRVTAVDPSEKMLAKLSERAGETPVETFTCPMQDYSADTRHDLALCVFSVITFLLDDRSLLAAFHASAHALLPGGSLLVDVPHGSVFESFEDETGDMIRSVEIEPLGGTLHRYAENTVLRTGDGPVSYRSEFEIRRWTADELLRATGAAGFILTEDLSERFAGLGADYFWLRRD